jgi:phage terminase small subunit
MSMATAKTVKIGANKGGLNGGLPTDKASLSDPAPMMARAPQPPDGMTEVAQEFWRKKCIHLRQIGRLHAIDLDALECLANLYADVCKTRQKMDNTLNDDLYLKYQKSHLEALKQFKDLSRDFGFTPASRGKLKGTATEAQKDDEWDKI